MASQGLFVAARAFLLDGVQYYVRVYRVGDDYQGHWECAQCGWVEGAEPVVSEDCNKVTDAARQLAEEHHRQRHTNELAAQN